MSKQTVTKKYLVDQISKSLKTKETKISSDRLNELTTSLLEQIKEITFSGEQVNIQGFGVFRVKETKTRKGRNPVTGEEIVIESRKVLKFYPSRALRLRLNSMDRFL
jgi:integration host factor subunit alpha